MAHIQIRISEQEKEYAQHLFSSMGLTMSGAIKLFIRKSIQKDALPFDVSARFLEEQKSIPKPKRKNKKKKKVQELMPEEVESKKTEPEIVSKEKKRNFANFINRDI